MPHHHNDIQLLSLDAVLTKRFPNDPFDAIPVYRTGQDFLARYDSKPGIALVVADKKNLEVFIRDMLCLKRAIKTIFAQQSVRSGEFGRCDGIKLRVWHGLWHDVH